MSHHIKGETKSDKKPMQGKDMKDTSGAMKQPSKPSTGGSSTKKS